MDYKSVFQRSLISEKPVDTTPADSDIWTQQNQTINDNPDLKAQFDVEGVPAEEADKYIKKVNAWQEVCQKTSQHLEEVYAYASKEADKPGASEIYSSIGRLVEKITRDLGTLGGQLRTLGNKVKVSIKKENEKNSIGK